MGRPLLAGPDRGPRCYAAIYRSSRSVTSGQAEAALHKSSTSCFDYTSLGILGS